MNPAKVRRDRLRLLTDLPNVGPAMASDLRLLGITQVDQLNGQDPWALYESLCRLTQTRHDPCVLDVFISITRFMSGEPPRPWWDFTDERKSGWVSHMVRLAMAEESRDANPNGQGYSPPLIQGVPAPSSWP